ncbi:MAG: hypothetical protein JST75_12310 [Bacteroidetes bacterium]|nr:hypothetical protein [Bacteroidota bacterium]
MPGSNREGLYLQHCNKNLSGNNIIRRISAGFLLLLFVLCVTPKKTLHDLIANHQDSPFASNTSAQQLSSNSGFRCNCDDLVVESPFVSDFIPIEVAPAAAHTIHTVLYAENFKFFHHFYFELRGPPSIS